MVDFLHIDCLFRSITGLPCPGCGITRAWLSFFKLDFGAAFYYHPLFLLVPFIFFVYLLRNKIKWCGKLSNSKYFYWGMLVLFIGVYLIRMLILFPHTEPMAFDHDALIPKIISKLFS